MSGSRSRSRSHSKERRRRRKDDSDSDDAEDWRKEAERREEARRHWSVSPDRRGREKKVEKKKPEEEYPEGSLEYQMAAMGLPVGFNTTKGTHVEGNDDFLVVDVSKNRKARQYMNKRTTKSQMEKIKVPIRR